MFVVIGISGCFVFFVCKVVVFKIKGKLIILVVSVVFIGSFLCYVVYVILGVVFFGSYVLKGILVWIYFLIYNVIYMVFLFIICGIVFCLLFMIVFCLFKIDKV